MVVVWGRGFVNEIRICVFFVNVGFLLESGRIFLLFFFYF